MMIVSFDSIKGRNFYYFLKLFYKKNRQSWEMFASFFMECNFNFRLTLFIKN
jgi:hypothetical protein